MAKKTVHKTAKVEEKKVEEKKVVVKDNSDSKLFAFLGVCLTLIGYIIVMLTRKDDKYAVYYAKHGLALFLLWIVVTVVGLILSLVPAIGQALQLLVVVLWVVGIVYAFSGEEKQIPLITAIAKRI